MMQLESDTQASVLVGRLADRHAVDSLQMVGLNIALDLGM